MSELLHRDLCLKGEKKKSGACKLASVSTNIPKLAGIMRIPGYGELKACSGHSEAARTRGHGQEADSRLG